MWPVLLLLTASPTWGLFSPPDTLTIQTLVSKNLTEGLGSFAEDILQTSYVGKIFTSEFSTFEIGDHEIDELLGHLVTSVEEKFEKARTAIQNVKKNLVAYYSQPRAPRSGPPRLVPSCCRPSPGSQYNIKLRLEVDPLHQCYARDLATVGQGFDLWADEALDLMKVNFETVPSILWQEVGTNDGLHVQFPNKNRFCDVRGNSNSPLLSKAYRSRLTQRPLNLVLVLDAGQEMVQPVHGSMPPVNHFQIVKRAAIDVLGTLTSRDKVTVVTAGRTVTVASSCNSSLMVNTNDKLNVLTDFIQKTTAAGSADYTGAFRRGFQLLTSQEQLDKASSQESTNVFIFLTNAESPLVLREKQFFQEIASGQSKLGSPALMLVYTLQMLGHQAAFETFHKLADQNNQKLAANDSRNVVTAGSWSQFNINEPVGPVGHIASISDKVKFGFSDHVAQFTDMLPNNAPTTDFVLDPVQWDTKEGVTVRSATPLSSEGANVYGVLATNLSVDVLLSSVGAFRHQLHSYAYVVEKGTGHVVLHPKLVAKTETTSRPIALTSLDTVEPDLTPEQITRIMSSNPTGSHFEAKIRPGREIFRAGRDTGVTAQSARVDHRLVRDTNFIVVMVIFDSELTQRVPAQHEVDAGPTSGVENRFDKLSSDQQMCLSSDLLAQEGKLGIKFSPDLFTDPQAYKYKDLTVSEREHLDTFIKNPAEVPAVLQPVIGNANLVADLTAVTSGELLTVWNNSETTPLQRFIGTASGILSLNPAVTLANKVDTRSYQWYTHALASPKAVVITTETFPGRTARTIISKALVDGQQTFGVVGASIPTQALRSFIISKVPLCHQGSYLCELVSSEGYLYDVLSASPAPPPGGRRHITKAYPWVANKLLQLNAMKPTWFLEAANHRNRLGYVITAPPSGVSSLAGPIDCKKFSLHKVGLSNVFLLVIAKRSPGQCPPDIETCASSPPVPPLPGRPPATVPLCSACANGVSVVPKCQNLCYCPMTTEACPTGGVNPRSGVAAVACQDEPGDLDPHEATPPPPHPGVPKCAAKCSEKTSLSECEKLTGCVWDLKRSLPTCVHLTPQTAPTPPARPQTPAKVSETSTTRATGGPQFERERDSNDSSDQTGMIVAIVVAGSVLAAIAGLLSYLSYKKWLAKARQVTDSSQKNGDSRSTTDLLSSPVDQPGTSRPSAWGV
ncbi:unnamed protein product [Lymnaea stagnalis]|uniref:VWFA domain-containing protein n=1 Tax=Lymnaea stagnalis TaxID=6523 RepID=A0AAV2HE83_LYMST